ncbi:Uncharacterized protein OS=Nitritalea halalkaliphila LW7 GN=A3SI_05714 PE=4 SV=1: DUF3817 [Tuwongella immobilis]|uniref:DUF3817 domain-containing protein n=2 Tax=Tuwongella immobilis TaxID=692036 RepID=A0A6C2YM81_9BACT|nr:Uncharacterized protein OS=Nitritalea halalkaliphila LW7 GN=A3SI_05714 PE=4 SV=1: DUF3817 [Tuwongella immobilis]VTS00786.1 Uncharacterized protein OS=Nitritalea halalkaliphila LW7 GN=A3SI_05714 PE=4 SV=1: DUF3817 [Tuwongella immobilis]
MIRNWLRWTRQIGKVEGISYLLLLGVAMPLKYLADWPYAVKVVGLAHGILFIAYWGVAAEAARRNQLPRKEFWRVAVASLIPFGPWWVDGKLLEWERSITPTDSQTNDAASLGNPSPPESTGTP